MSIAAKIRSFLADTSGGSLPFALALTMGSFMVGGLALDLSYAYKSRHELQIAADAAAHAALYVRQSHDAATAKKRALQIAYGTLPPSSYGKTLSDADILFGHWDFASQTFKPDPTSTEAVLVSTKRFESHGNPVQTMMLNFIGVEEFNVRADAVFVTHYPNCLRQGFAATETVELQSNNKFYNGFCLHSNDKVTMSQSNEFEAGAVVSMPDSTDADKHTPANDGLAEALEDHSYHLRVLEHLGAIVKSMQNGGSFVPDYIVNKMPIVVKTDAIVGVDPNGWKSDADAAVLQTGRIFLVFCGDDDGLTIAKDVVLKDMVILTPCPLKFPTGAAIENSNIVTMSTSKNSIKATSGFRIGVNDNCAEGGGATVITFGGISALDNLQIYGGQIVALGDISFTSKAAIEGVSIVSGGKITGTSDSHFRFCQDGIGIEHNIQMPYFRLAG